jgi:hypothetical protein
VSSGAGSESSTTWNSSACVLRAFAAWRRELMMSRLVVSVVVDQMKLLHDEYSPYLHWEKNAQYDDENLGNWGNDGDNRICDA